MSAPRGLSRQMMSRRAFLHRGAMVAAALPTAAAILAACSKPGSAPSAQVSGGGTIDLNHPPTKDNPITLPMVGKPIPTDTPIEDATVQIFNWDNYMWKKTLGEFHDVNGQHRDYEYTTFHNEEDGVSKLTQGQVTPDVFFPTPDYMPKLVLAGELQPLNHALIPNIKGMWPEFSSKEGPWYDPGWRYSVPYTIYTTGIAYRRDKISDAEMASKGYDILWDPKYKGKVGIYDDYREAIIMCLLRNGITDVNTSSQADIDKAKADLLSLLDLVDVRDTTNGVYAKLPEGDFWVHQAWSGDIVGAQWYMPKGVSTDVLGYWFPEDGKGVIGSDCISVPAVAEHPRLGHEFLNFWISDKYATENFVGWNGYQPPLNSIDPTKLIDQGSVPPTLERAVVLPSDFDNGYIYTSLPPDVDQMWLDAWNEFKAGG